MSEYKVTGNDFQELEDILQAWTHSAASDTYVAQFSCRIRGWVIEVIKRHG